MTSRTFIVRGGFGMFGKRMMKTIGLMLPCVLLGTGIQASASPLSWYLSRTGEEEGSGTEPTGQPDESSGWQEPYNQTGSSDTVNGNAGTYDMPQISLTLHEQKICSPLFNGAAVGRTTIPDGWFMQVTDLSVGTESITCPDAILLTVSSPDGACEMTFISRREFEQSYTNMYGIEAYSADDQYDWTDMMHFLNYREAGEVCDLLTGVVYGSGQSLVREIPLTEDEAGSLQTVKNAYLDEVRQVTAAYTNAGVYVGELQGTDVTGGARVYSDGAKLTTTRAMSMGYELYQEGNGFYSDIIFWAIPEVFMLRTNPDVHDSYQEVFDVFCASTCVSQEYEQMRELHGQKLVNAMLAARNAGYDYSYSSSDSDYEELGSSTVDSGDTYSAFDAWDDYIRDETDYTTGDGSHVKLPNSYDHVFEGDNGTIYAGSSPDGPAGSIELNPTQIGN